MQAMTTTPEGFELAKPLYLPNARSFDEVLTYCGEWKDAERPEPRYIVFPGDESLRDRRPEGNAIGPYCTVETPEERFRSIAVVATDATIEALRARIVTPDDTLSFKVIVHPHNGRALILAQHNYILGDIWLAYVDPATIPPKP